MAKKKIEFQKEVDLTLIDPPDFALRMEIDHDYIAELAQSISEIGLLQPILLARVGNRFEIVAGQCRFLAHQKAGLLKIKAIVRDMSREEIVIARATENLNRKDLTPIEEASTYLNLINVHGISIDDVAKKVGKSRGLVKRRMDLLRMPAKLQDAVHKKKISISVAEELWPISDETALDYYLSFALDGGCTRDVARAWCKDWRDSVRRDKSAGESGGETYAPNEPRPIYVTCDLCTGPMELGHEIPLRICSACFKTIKDNM